MRRVLTWLLRLGLVGVVLIAGLLSPVAYNELACIPQAKPETYEPILPPEHRRDESRTLMTYPEWHIVHAYDDYAQVISAGDPHAFGYIQAIGGFWSSLCALSYESAEHGGFTAESKQTIYVIGVSFTAELLAKAAYEETLGRLAAWWRGPERAPLDDLSADQARAYAQFLQQVPWYKWDFEGDRDDLATNATDSLRDRERRFALGLEYGAKAAYAKAIEGAVAQVGADALTLRMIVTGISEEALRAMGTVEVIGPVDGSLEIETPRYRELTHILQQMAEAGAEFVEIAGNDQIMFTALSQTDAVDGAIHSFQRQGYGDSRHLIMVNVTDLAGRLRQMEDAEGVGRLRLEHIHDY